jgi:hypothetical protein
MQSIWKISAYQAATQLGIHSRMDTVWNGQGHVPPNLIMELGLKPWIDGSCRSQPTTGAARASIMDIFRG